MVVETETSEIVAYARWLVPPKLQDSDKDGKAVFWSEAQIPEPAPAQREAYEAEWKRASINGHPIGSNPEMVHTLSAPLEAEDRRVQNGEEWLGKLVPKVWSLSGMD